MLCILGLRRVSLTSNDVHDDVRRSEMLVGMRPSRLDANGSSLMWHVQCRSC